MKLRYVELPPDRIFNIMGPEHITAWYALKATHSGRWWEPETVELRHTFGEVWTEEFDKITGHFTKLERSMRANGIQHPASTMAGPNSNPQLNPSDTDLNELVYTYPFGGSRVTIARKLGLKIIPCVVHDRTNLFPTAIEVTQRNFRTWFGNGYSFSSAVPFVRLLRHAHIPTGQYNGMTGATRMAQRQAGLITKRRLGI